MIIIKVYLNKKIKTKMWSNEFKRPPKWPQGHEDELLEFAKRFTTDPAFAQSMCQSVESWDKSGKGEKKSFSRDPNENQGSLDEAFLRVTWWKKGSKDRVKDDLDSLYVDIEAVWSDWRLTKAELMYVFQRLKSKEYIEQNQKVFSLIENSTGKEYDFLGKVYKFLNDLLFLMLRKWFTVKEKADYDFLQENWYKEKLNKLGNFHKLKWKVVIFVWENLILAEDLKTDNFFVQWDQLIEYDNKDSVKTFDTDPDILNVSVDNLNVLQKFLYIFLKDVAKDDNTESIDSFKWLEKELKQDNLVIAKGRFNYKQKQKWQKKN
mgnify:FL=1